MATKSTKTFPAAADIYAARYADGLTWAEMRSHFSVSARSSRFLSECVAFVNADAELLAKHPEMAFIEVGGDKYADVGAEARELIRAERERGVGLAMLRERTGLSMAVLRKIVGEEVGTTSRVAWGARYSGKTKPTEEATEATEEATEPVSLVKATPEPTPEPEAPQTTPEVVEEPKADAPKRAPRRRRTAKK